MNQYLAGTAVNLPIEFTDEDGNPLLITSASYRVIDQDGIEIVARTDFDIASTTLQIASEHNVIPPLDIDALTVDKKDGVELNQARTVEFDVVLQDGNTIGHDISYVIYPRERLVVGLNSFQNLSQATVTASAIYDTETFDQASAAQRVAALIEARDRIAQLSFVDIKLGQSYLGHGEPINLNKITPREYLNLSERFKLALRKAQIAESNVILGGGDITEQLRQQGLLSQTIGETHETYRQGMPINTLVSKATLRYLSEFLVSSKKITRV